MHYCCMCRQLFNAQTRKLQIAQETVAKRDGKPQPQPVEEGADAEGGEDPEGMSEVTISIASVHAGSAGSNLH